MTPAVMGRQIARIRADRVATISRPHGPAYASVAAPVFGTGAEPLAAISVVAPPLVLTPSNVRAAVVAIAEAMSRQLGGHRAGASLTWRSSYTGRAQSTAGSFAASST